MCFLCYACRVCLACVASFCFSFPVWGHWAFEHFLFAWPSLVKFEIQQVSKFPSKYNHFARFDFFSNEASMCAPLPWVIARDGNSNMVRFYGVSPWQIPTRNHMVSNTSGGSRRKMKDVPIHGD